MTFPPHRPRLTSILGYNPAITTTQSLKGSSPVKASIYLKPVHDAGTVAVLAQMDSPKICPGLGVALREAILPATITWVASGSCYGVNIIHI
ncbi:MAG: hypothetical protein GY847_32080 [Proteobacteria bacterium]|nr:hypothetical protein [Pseudomonadota bacterium]